ncbi:MAG TPA: 2OG-Fe dioxygenase family protein [Mycobacterium sp.]|nr:2OG-Fe dioxygenase family protein [Mycobacterium sp.]
MTPSKVGSCLDADDADWIRFAQHWDELMPDTYAAELGTRRLRRYGHFRFADGVATPMPHDAFVQPDDSNPLYLQRDRYFEPLTDAFADDPLLKRLLTLLGRLAAVLDNVAVWSAKVTPFRVLASAEDTGQPTPEGLHRDGVTLVSSLLINRHNARGGESSVVDMNGNSVLTTTLSQPGTLLLGDDRRTMHGVSPIRPIDTNKPARRDVLVITFAPALASSVDLMHAIREKACNNSTLGVADGGR